MADIATLVQTYLSIPSKPKRLNYYTILGLVELIDDRAAIAVALESAIQKLKSVDRAADPEGFEQVAKVLRQARATLLDEEKKRAYDVQLNASVAKKPLNAEVHTPTASSSSKSNRLFPPGDPNAPFSASEFLKQPLEQREPETAAQRHIAIAELAKNASYSSPAVNRPIGEANDQRIPSLSGPLLNMDRPSSGHNAGRELQEMIRRNRKKKNALAAGIAIGGSLVVVLIGVWMFVSNRMEQERQVARNADGASLANVFHPTVVNDGDAPMTEENGVVASADKPRMNLGVTPQATSETLGALPKIGADDLPPEVPSETVNAVMPPVEVAPQAPMKTQDAKVEPAMVGEAPKVPGSVAGTGKWAERMAAAQKTAKEKDFEKFAIEIENALQVSTTETQEQHAHRLDKYVQLYEKSLAVTKEALSALNAAEEIKFGSAGGKVSVVESSDNLLIVRKGGENLRFKYDEIPIGILMSVAETKLTDSPMDHVIRGILLTLSPLSNASNKQQANVHFEKAASMDAEFANLDGVLDEKFQ